MHICVHVNASLGVQFVDWMRQCSSSSSSSTATLYNTTTTTKHSVPSTQHRHHQLMMTVSAAAVTGTWPLWPATPDVMDCTTKRLARKERQFQHVRALCGPSEPPLHGSSVSPQTDTCIKRN